MKMIALIAAVSVALSVAARADSQRWRDIPGADGIVYRVNLDSIKRKTMDHSDLPSGAKVLVYRDDGGPIDDQAFFTMVFDCRGRFMLWHHPEDTRRITPKSFASKLEDIACWGPTR